MARIRRDHRSKKIEDHLVDKTKFVEIGVEDAPVKDIGWDVQKAEVHSDPVYDSGTGPKAIIRRFSFKLPPGLREELTEQEILDYHKKNTVIPMLFKDELELLDEPRIIAGTKGSFTIVAICSPRFVMGVRSHIHEEATNVTELINASNNPDKLH